MHERKQARRGQRAAQHATLRPRPAFAPAGGAAHFFFEQCSLLLLDVLPGCVAEFLAAARLLAA